ncbi:glycosyltransferase family 2 protein [Candidatus Saccharibacteria bacterium]|nr:glycosyltransferase family 2 protein [Candidatus Saccharibacteria bacterium]
MNPKVSIIIPTFNAEDTLERCINSVLEQTYNNLEIIIINDGSTDKTAEIGKKLAKKNTQIKYIFQENRGVSSARNNGIKKASGEYIFFLDSDDTIDVGVIMALINSREEGTLNSSRIFFKDKKRETEIHRESSYRSEDIIKKIACDELQGFSWGYLFERDKCAMYNENINYLEDVIFLVEYIRRNKIKSIKFIPKSSGIYYYYENDNSVTKSNKNINNKLESIVNATNILKETAEHKYDEEIENMKIRIFEAEIAKVDRREFMGIIDRFHLKKYTGKRKYLKVFSRFYRSKNIMALKLYYMARYAGKKIITA